MPSQIPEVTSEMFASSPIDAERLIGALSRAIMLMANIGEPTAERLDDMMLFRSIREDLKAKKQEVEYDAERHRVLSAFETEAGQTSNYTEKVQKLASDLGVSVETCMAMIAEKFERRLIAAGIDPDEFRVTMNQAVDKGPVEVQRVLKAVEQAMGQTR